MSLVSHLHGSVALTGSVGKGGMNKLSDLKTARALLNVYQRAASQPIFPPDITVDDLTPAIEQFQKQQLNIPAPDGRIDPGGKTLNGLLRYLRSVYTTMSITPPAKGKLTWDVEGREGGPYHSRRLHVPSARSGLTLGRGYDMRERRGPSIQKDLASMGVPSDIALRISQAGGTMGPVASRFVIDKDLLDYEITPQMQLKLFEKVYGEKLNEVKRISELAGTVRDYGKVDWKNLDQRILDMLIDLIYRGDYTKTSRTFLQIHVANNDFSKFKAEILKKSNWPNVPPNRFKERNKYIESALSPV